MAVKIPDKVKIGPTRYEVKRRKKISADNGRKLCGEIDYMNARISLSSKMHDERAFGVLMHEVLHGCDYDAETGLTEDQISRLSTHVAAFMVDNGYAKDEE